MDSPNNPFVVKEVSDSPYWSNSLSPSSSFIYFDKIMMKKLETCQIFKT